MKKWLILLVLVLSITCTASAYEISIESPPSIIAGETLVVNGTSNLPAGTTVEIIFSKAEYTTDELATRSVTIQGEGVPFNLSFDTSGFPRGTYKVEVQPIGGFSYLGDSVTLRVVELIDRSDEIDVRTKMKQYFDGTLDIDGILDENHKEGAEITVMGPDGDTIVFGPQYIPTSNDGYFSTKVTIPGTGLYRVGIADSKGYIGTVQFTVLSGDSGPGTPTVTSTMTPSAEGNRLSASAPASREKPAYFAVKLNNGGETSVSTSAGIDWVIEYIDSSGTRKKMNENGAAYPEEIVVPGTGSVLYVMVTPYKYSDQGTVSLTASNAELVETSSSAASLFASAATATSKAAPTSSPMAVWLGIAAACGAALIAVKRRG